MTIQELLRELEMLPFAARCLRMVGIGKEAARDRRFAALLDTLEQGGFYERSLALQSCYGSRDGERALRSLSDPSRGIRNMALILVPLVCDDTQAMTALEAVLLRQKANLLRRMVKLRRQAVADAYLERLAERKEERLNRLLPFGSSDCVLRHLASVLARMGAEDWKRLTRFHPTLAVETLKGISDSQLSLDMRLIWQVNALLPLAAKSQPDSALALVQSMAKHTPLNRLLLSALVEQRPKEMADLLLDSDSRANIVLDGVAHKLGTERLTAMLERYREAFSQTSFWMKRLLPHERTEVFQKFHLAWRGPEGINGDALVALLPRELREQEGRRHFNLPALVTRPEQRLPYTSFLPWEEAKQALDPYLRNPDADLRVAAYAALVSAVRYNRDRLAELLALLVLRRNEQDPVRLSMLRGLSDLPPGIWQQEYLELLGQVLRSALDAADLSEQTARYGELLILRLLPFHAAWSAEWMAVWAKERGRIQFHSLETALTGKDVRRLAPILLPVLQTWKSREREGQLLGFAQSLGRRLRVFPELLGLLEKVLQQTATQWIAERALYLIAEYGRDLLAVVGKEGIFWQSKLADYRPDRAAELIPALVQADPSWITRPLVYNYLHRKRQDLLTPFLGRQAYKGRFSTGRTRFVLPLMDGFHRWTAQQQQTFLQILNEVTQDTDRDSPALSMVITQLAALPAVTPTRLFDLADARNPRPITRDWALRALANLDGGQGVPVLLEAMGDDRARIAIYALRRALMEMPPAAALQMLLNVPLNRVTVAKEVIRLIGDLRTEEAYRELLKLNEHDLHRDVRVAVLRGLWEHLEREETWDILEQSASSEYAAVAAIVGRTPSERLSQESQSRLLGILALLLKHQDPKVRLDVLKRCAELPVNDPQRVLLPRLLTGLNSAIPDEIVASAKAVLQTYTGQDAPVVGQAIQTILPNRRALHGIIDCLMRSIFHERGRLLPLARQALSALADDPLTVTLRVRLAVWALTIQEVGDLVEQMAAARELHADALTMAITSIEARVSWNPDDTEFTMLERRLKVSEDRYVRRFAFALLSSQARWAGGWTSERLQYLEEYRRDPAPLVAEAAQFTFPNVEENEGR